MEVKRAPSKVGFIVRRNVTGPEQQWGSGKRGKGETGRCSSAGAVFVYVLLRRSL